MCGINWRSDPRKNVCASRSIKMDDYEYKLLDMSQEEMERIANGDDPEDTDL